MKQRKIGTTAKKKEKISQEVGTFPKRDGGKSLVSSKGVSRAIKKKEKISQEVDTFPKRDGGKSLVSSKGVSRAISIEKARAITSEERLEDLIASSIPVRGLPKSIRKLADYFFEAHYDDLAPEVADEYFRNDYWDNRSGGGCSAVRNGKFYGRNYDLTYSKAPTFAIKLEAKADRRASWSICGVPTGVTQQMIEERDVDDSVWQTIPFICFDGINDCGVVCNNNVVHANPERDKGWKGTEICGRSIVRYVLDHARTAEEGAEMIAEKAWMPDPEKFSDFALHYLVADANSTFIVEDGVVHDISADPIKAITNFRVKAGNFIKDGEVNKDLLAAIDPFGSGVERYNKIIAGDSMSSMSATKMRELLDSMHYTQAYNRATNPFWYSEFTGIEIPDLKGSHKLVVNDPPEKFNIYLNNPIGSGVSIYDLWEEEKRLERRSGVFWQTVHSTVYDILAKTLSVRVQEKEEIFNFSLFNDGKTQLQTVLSGEILRIDVVN